MHLKSIPKFSFRIYKDLRKIYGNKCLFCSEYHTAFPKLVISLNRKISRCTSLSESLKEKEGSDDNDTVEKKIIYNSILNRWGFVDRKRFEKREKKRQILDLSQGCEPVSLKYISSIEEEPELPLKNHEDKDLEYTVTLPYKLKSVQGDIFLNKNESPETSSKELVDKNLDFRDLILDKPSGFIGNWMNDYEKYSDETADEDDDIAFWRQDYGTPDTYQPLSNVPCGGCGALLHCQDQSIPGYLPSEIYKNCSKKDLRETVCQRCHFLKNYNTALSVTVDSKDYPRIISQIKDTKSLVVLIADMADLPCSIWPGILNLIGPKQPLFLVGNKIDLIPGDRRGWIKSAHSFLRSCLPKNAYVYHTTLISAKTGFGVEELINKLHTFWQYKGDVYLVGCVNVGKSTLFNALLQSDYCKVKAADLIQRATTAPWPGTTLNLLKFPILRPEGWRLHLRAQRLIKERKSKAAENQLKRQQNSKVDKNVCPQLIGHIGRTFPRNKRDEVAAIDNFTTGKALRFGLDPNDPDFRLSKWVYDTPGVLTKEQFLDLLTTEEVLLTVPKDVIKPRSFVMKVGWTLFIAGIARMDYISGNRNIKVTIFSAPALPVTILPLEHSEEVYSKLLGSKILSIPRGPEERLHMWPGLKMAKEISLIGVDKQESCADVTLSSAGWVSITPFPKEIIKMSFWTPEGRGVFMRSPSLLPKTIALRGKKNVKLPVYGKTRPFISK